MSLPSGAAPLHGITTRVPRSATRKGRVALGVEVTARPYRRAVGPPEVFSPDGRTPVPCSTRTRDGPLAPPRTAPRAGAVGDGTGPRTGAFGGVSALQRQSAEERVVRVEGAGRTLDGAEHGVLVLGVERVRLVLERQRVL